MNPMGKSIKEEGKQCLHDLSYFPQIWSMGLEFLLSFSAGLKLVNMFDPTTTDTARNAAFARNKQGTLRMKIGKLYKDAAFARTISPRSKGSRKVDWFWG